MGSHWRAMLTITPRLACSRSQNGPTSQYLAEWLRKRYELAWISAFVHFEAFLRFRADHPSLSQPPRASKL